MATLVLGALGTLVGGPLGGAIGALAGRQLDAAILRPGGREGPRLKDLAISTSSYGQPIPQVFGTARVAGSIIWATDLVESRSTSGGGKGKPKVTSFSYSSSFAVAVSSRPIIRIGRIWADGQLIRGGAGDLKAGGAMRVHTGWADQPVDPLLASATQGGVSPAYRDCAYVVFENLQLADFGNRIPALSFEVVADDGGLDLKDMVHGTEGLGRVARALSGLAGFEQTGGTLRDTIGLLSTFYPVSADVSDGGLVIGPAPDPDMPTVTLPDLLASNRDDDFGPQSGQTLVRSGTIAPSPDAIRYYDQARDYQPGVQRAEGDGAARSAMVEFPGVLAAATARDLLAGARSRSGSGSSRLLVRIGTIDPGIAPGAVVSLTDHPGRWMVAEWEWRDTGIELTLERLRQHSSHGSATDAGEFTPPPDLAGSPTSLLAFELPLDGPSQTDAPRRYLAVSAASPGWHGAELLVQSGPGFITVGSSGRQRAIFGQIETALPGSPSLVLEQSTSVDLVLIGTDMTLTPASARDLAFGANRLLIGDEIVQFCDSLPLGNGRWRLRGLLRGRGGTEHQAQAGHPPGTAAVLLDERLVPVDGLLPAAATAITFAAIGLSDEEPPLASLSGGGTTLRPLAPVHPRARPLPDGALALTWARRARGAWYWIDGVDVPLIEQSEKYRVGAGDLVRPAREWETGVPRLELGPDQLTLLAPGTPLWVQQVGSHAISPPLLLFTLP